LHVATKCMSEDAPVENEIAALQTVIGSPLRYMAGLMTTSGLKVQVIDGPLRNVEGILVDPESQRLALGISLLGRSVLVDLEEGTEVVPIFRASRKSVPVPA